MTVPEPDPTPSGDGDHAARSDGETTPGETTPEETRRSIRVENLTRVEGEGGLDIRLRDGRPHEVRLKIFEPPRFFEAMLRGRPGEEAPDITARICGICPVAYQMSSVHAIEAAWGIDPGPEIRRLRRLLYCAEWIESHALHVHLLHAPDFLGYPGSLEMSRDYPEQITRGLQIRKAGNALLDTIGGRAVHPINVAVGGFYKAPARDTMAAHVGQLEAVLPLAIETTRWVAGFDFPDFEPEYQTVCLVHPDEYPMNEGRIEASDGLSITSDEYESWYVERQVPHSTAMHAVRQDTGQTYLLGPLARLNRCREQLMPAARRLADEIGWQTPCRNPYRMIVARALEVVHAVEEAIEILRDYRQPRPARVDYHRRAADGTAATEAPRGLLYHRYELADDGRIEHANIVPPTSQNQSQIERDLAALLTAMSDPTDGEIAESCERLVRCFDPCISCSTHFLKVRVRRESGPDGKSRPDGK